MSPVTKLIGMRGPPYILWIFAPEHMCSFSLALSPSLSPPLSPSFIRASIVWEFIAGSPK